MDFYERRPVFEAARFTGPESVKDVLSVFSNRVLRYTLESESTGMHIKVEDPNKVSWTVSRGMWVVRNPLDRSISLVSNDDFCDRFEQTKV